jgi:YfiH family protein
VRFRRVPAGAHAVAEIAFTNRADGDFHIDRADDDLRQHVFDGPWTWLRQVHGARVAVVDSFGAKAGDEGDAAVTGLLDAVLCVQTADCVPVVLVGDGVVGVAHAGWRGLVEGVIPNAVEALAALGGGFPIAMIGPCIRAASYEFGEADLALVEAAVGGPVRATTASGMPALDMARATAHALTTAGVVAIDDLGIDTADEVYFSHRVRADEGRQVTAVRLVAS